MSRHRLEPFRPRYGRIAATLISVVVTMTAVLAGAGLVPAAWTGAAEAGIRSGSLAGTGVAASIEKRVAPPIAIGPPVTIAPPASGSGKRVVFSQDDQRVWLIDDGNEVQRTYPVSGSVYDNLDKGTFEVFSTSENAQGIDDSGTMKWFVRFARGPNAAIGFHDIPVDNGKPLQTEAELGEPRSHGCIRQSGDDARALWAFAPVGTTVVVI